MDIFERIRQITTPKPTRPDEIGSVAVQKGLQAVNQIRSSLNITPKPTTSFQTRIPTFSETQAFKPSIQPAIQTQITTPRINLQKAQQAGERVATAVMPTPKPSGIKGIEKLVPIVSEMAKEVITPASPVLKGYKEAKVKDITKKATESLSKAFDTTNQLTAGERILEGLSAVGTVLSYPNEVIVQPRWDALKLGLKAVRTGEVTDSDIQNYFYTTGSEKGTLFDAIGINEDDFGKKFGNNTLQTVRFFDFAPELLDLQMFKGGELATVAREVKLGKEALGEAERIKKLVRLTEDEKNIIDTVRDAFFSGEVEAGKQLFDASGIKRFTFEDIQTLVKNEIELDNKRNLLEGNIFNFPQINQYIPTINRALRVYNLNKRKGIDDLATLTKKVRGLDEAIDAFRQSGQEIESINDLFKQYSNYINLRNDVDRLTKITQGRIQASQVDEAIANFEAQTGEKLTQEVKDLITKSVDNPKGLVDNLTKETGKAGGAGVPPSGNIPTFLQPIREVPVKERKFPISVSKAEGTAKEVKNILKDRFDLYSPIKNKDEFAKASKFVAENNVDDVIEYIKFTEDPREVSYIGQALMQKLQKEGNFARVIDVLDIVSEQGTIAGQTAQALSIWGRLTPEGALRTANNLVRRYNQDNKLTQGMTGFLKLSDDKIARITEQARKVEKAEEGYQKALESAILLSEIAKSVPASIGTKIATFQTLSQLLNPKTFIRNVLGNAIFGSIDSLTQTFATPLDMAISLYTKKRTVAPASLQKQISGGVEGFKKGMQEALAGADTSQLASQFDLPNGSVFDSKVMQGFEKALNVTLKAPDRAFYEASYKDTLDGLLKLNKVDTPTKEMLEMAHYEALRRTFQDENRISKLFTSAKRALNYIGTKDRSFGLGDIILKYPKTPANLLVRALEYSPVNYVRAVMELARPLMGGAFDQRAFVQNIARATVGTGMINLGLSLGKLGILTPRPDSDKDARNAQDLQGVQSYSFNTSALKRYVLSGFDAEAAKPRVGDQLFSYDWAQPASLPLAIGANLSETNGKLKEGTFSERVLLTFGPLAGEIIKSSDTLTEQSLLQGIQRLFGYGGLQQGLLENILAIPQSFVPTILNQINQYTDNASRETYSPDLFESSFNQFSARVPILAQRLPQRVDVLGRPKERFPNGSNTFFNVFFNPAFVDQIKADPTLNEVISLYEQTGEKGQFPRVVDKTITINGEKRLLTSPEIINYQKNLGQLSDRLIRNAILNKQYQELPTTEKALFIGNVLSDANKITKVQLFGESDTDLSGRLQMLQNNDFENYLTETLQNKQEQLRKEQLKAQGLSYKKVRLPSIKKARGRKVRLPKPKKLKLKVKLPKIKKPKKQKPIKLQSKV